MDFPRAMRHAFVSFPPLNGLSAPTVSSFLFVFQRTREKITCPHAVWTLMMHGMHLSKDVGLMRTGFVSTTPGADCAYLPAPSATPVTIGIRTTRAPVHKPLLTLAIPAYTCRSGFLSEEKGKGVIPAAAP